MKKPSVSASVRDKVMASLQKMTSTKASDPSAEFTQSTGQILSAIKFVLSVGDKVYDDVTGYLPFGRIVEIYGVDASGKTALAKKAAISAQLKNIYQCVVTTDSSGAKVNSYVKLDPDKVDVHVLYIDNEQSLSDDNSLVIDGVQANFIIGRCDTITLVFEALQRIISVVEDAEVSGREQFIVVVVDTIASTSTTGEMDQDFGKQDYSRHAKELRAGFRRVTREINRHNVCLICINQVSDSFMPRMKKNPNALPDEADFSTFGGRALKFYASQRIFVQKVQKKYRLHPDNRNEDGLLIQMKTVKNRLKKPLRTARLVLLFGDQKGAGGGYTEVYSILETMIYLGLAKDDSGSISFRFSAHGIVPSTFESKRANPSIDNRLEWPAYYQEHKVDFDKLWTVAEKLIFSSENTPDDGIDTDEDGDELFSKKSSKDDIEDLE